MSIEIEDKFIVDRVPPLIYENCRMEVITQGYVPIDNTKANLVNRIRIKNDKAYYTYKIRKSKNEDYEIEHEMDMGEAELILKYSEIPIIKKNRYYYPFEGHVFEIDVFLRENEGLVIVEVERGSVEELVEYPTWLKPFDDVVRQKRYKNFAIAQHPYKNWTDEEKDKSYGRI